MYPGPGLEISEFFHLMQYLQDHMSERGMYGYYSFTGLQGLQMVLQEGQLLTCWRLIPGIPYSTTREQLSNGNILEYFGIGNVCYNKIKLSSTG